jgi:hypothetical protein
MSTALERKKQPPQPALKPGIIYSGDNGQLICIHCAGMSALFTGYDRSGHKVEALDADFAREWRTIVGKNLACESGCTEYRDI